MFLEDQLRDADSLRWLMEWFLAQCDGDWEHGYGVRIETLDNSGWSIRVELKGTMGQGRSLEREKYNYDHDLDW